MQSLCYILNTYSATIHTLISLKAIWRIKLFEPKKLGITLAAITFELWVHCDNIPTACNGIEYIPNAYHRV
jgi:hypothetical protein